MQIIVHSDRDALATAAAGLFVETAREAIAKQGKFTVALTGGSTPEQLYKLLATPAYREQVDWANVWVFWGDERWVPLDDPKSNARMSRETLLDHVGIPEGQIFPMYQDGVAPEAYAAAYEASLRQVLGDEGAFDLILLGMGDDGHTASLFPGTAVLGETEKWVDAYFLEPQDMYRITLTAPLINRAKKIVFALFGVNKAPALYEVLEGKPNIQTYPAQLIKPTNGEVVWLVDESAVAKLTQKG